MNTNLPAGAESVDGKGELEVINRTLRSAWQTVTNAGNAAIWTAPGSGQLTPRAVAAIDAGTDAASSHHRLASLIATLPGARTRDIRPGKRILPAPDSHIVVLVERGALALSLARQRGETIILLLYGPGRFCAPPRPTDEAAPIALTALLPSRLIEVPREELLNASLVRPELTTVLVRIERNLHALLDRTVALLERNPERRIAATLLYLAHELDEPCATGRGTRISLSQESIAAAAGLARQTANRLLRRLNRSGIVTLDTRLVCVLDGERLRRIAAGLETSRPANPGSAGEPCAHDRCTCHDSPDAE